MVNYFLKENIYVVTEEEEKNIIKEERLNLKENIYSIMSGQEKDMMMKEMLFMN